MTDRHDNELQALFDSAGQELPGDAFNARIMAGIDGWETTSRILSVLQRQAGDPEIVVVAAGDGPRNRPGPGLG